jgi:hypothetical protein
MFFRLAGFSLKNRWNSLTTRELLYLFNLSTFSDEVTKLDKINTVKLNGRKQLWHSKIKIGLVKSSFPHRETKGKSP